MIYNLLGISALQVKKLPEGSKEARELDGTFGKEYFDGDRQHGYGGYHDDGRWGQVAVRLQERYHLGRESRILELGCAKGFLLKELAMLIPGITLRGFEVSQYAKAQAPELVRDRIDLGYPTQLPYGDDMFDLVLAINALHFMPEPDVRRTLAEILRVTRPGGNIFIQVDSYMNALQLRSMQAWAPVVKCLMTPDQWDALFVNEKISVDSFYTIIELEDFR